MVYDGENTFYWKKALNGMTTGTSDVVQTGKVSKLPTRQIPVLYHTLNCG